jgi:hypothetical protein
MRELMGEMSRLRQDPGSSSRQVEPPRQAPRHVEPERPRAPEPPRETPKSGGADLSSASLARRREMLNRLIGEKKDR